MWLTCDLQVFNSDKEYEPKDSGESVVLALDGAPDNP